MTKKRKKSIRRICSVVIEISRNTFNELKVNYLISSFDMRSCVLCVFTYSSETVCLLMNWNTGS